MGRILLMLQHLQHANVLLHIPTTIRALINSTSNAYSYYLKSSSIPSQSLLPPTRSALITTRRTNTLSTSIVPSSRISIPVARRLCASSEAASAGIFASGSLVIGVSASRPSKNEVAQRAKARGWDP